MHARTGLCSCLCVFESTPVGCVEARGSYPGTRPRISLCIRRTTVGNRKRPLQAVVGLMVVIEELGPRLGLQKSTCTLLLLLFAGTIFCEILRFGKSQNLVPAKITTNTSRSGTLGVHIHTLRVVFYFGTSIIILF